MKIELNIGKYTLGDDNSEAENQRYADAVLAAIESEYPDAIVYVDLVRDSTSCAVTGATDDSEIRQNVEQIRNSIWNNESY